MAELDALLQPIDPDKPSGDDLRLVSGDLTFGDMDELRRESDPAIDPGGEAKAADWPGVRKLCEESLAGRTKDLEIAAVLTQALVHLEGWSGFQTGLQLITAYLETFWDTVYPGWDEGEIIEPIRARPLSWLGTSQEFLSAVKSVPLSAPIGEPARSWFDYEQAQRVDEASTKADQVQFQEFRDAGMPTIDEWRGSLTATPPDRLETTVAGLRQSIALLAGLDAACADRFEDQPYFTDLSALLDNILLYLEQYQSQGAGTVAEEGAVPGQPAAAVSVGGGSAGPINNRDEAYRRLREVAEYLRKTEPHSPVPPLLDRAVRWGNMAFENLFDDFVKNEDARNQTRDLLGLRGSDQG